MNKHLSRLWANVPSNFTRRKKKSGVLGAGKKRVRYTGLALFDVVRVSASFRWSAFLFFLIIVSN